jgi:hypothetical protein
VVVHARARRVPFLRAGWVTLCMWTLDPKLTEAHACDPNTLCPTCAALVG